MSKKPHPDAPPLHLPDGRRNPDYDRWWKSTQLSDEQKASYRAKQKLRYYANPDKYRDLAKKNYRADLDSKRLTNRLSDLARTEYKAVYYLRKKAERLADPQWQARLAASRKRALDKRRLNLTKDQLALRLSEVNLAKGELHQGSLRWSLISPNGVVYRFSNVSHFVRSNRDLFTESELAVLPSGRIRIVELLRRLSPRVSGRPSNVVHGWRWHIDNRSLEFLEDCNSSEARQFIPSVAG